MGHAVWAVDIDDGKIAELQAGRIPIYEPGLDQLIAANVQDGRLTFSTEVVEGIREADIVFITVGTPSDENGSADLSSVKAVAKTIASGLDRYKIIVNKSTVPVGSTVLVARVIQENLKTAHQFDVVSNPEFLREGSAVADAMHPDRIVVGVTSERAAQAIAALREKLQDIPEAGFAAFTALHEPDYWLRTTPDQQVRHAHMITDAGAGAGNEAFVTDVSAHAFEGVTEISIFTPTHPRLLAMIAGACTSGGANIVGAQITTTRDGHALDIIRLAREFDRSEDEERRAERIAGAIRALMEGKFKIDDIMKNRPKPKESLKVFSVEPQVVIDNNLSDALTVIEINCLDRPGLLYDLTREIADAKLDIASAHIATFGEKVVDVFYVTDLAANKVTNEARQTAIRKRLHRVLAAGYGG